MIHKETLLTLQWTKRSSMLNKCELDYKIIGATITEENQTNQNQLTRMMIMILFIVQTRSTIRSRICGVMKDPKVLARNWKQNTSFISPLLAVTGKNQSRCLSWWCQQQVENFGFKLGCNSARLEIVSYLKVVIQGFLFLSYIGLPIFICIALKCVLK